MRASCALAELGTVFVGFGFVSSYAFCSWLCSLLSGQMWSTLSLTTSVMRVLDSVCIIGRRRSSLRSHDAGSFFYYGRFLRG